jgi:hypothetical protein
MDFVPGETGWIHEDPADDIYVMLEMDAHKRNAHCALHSGLTKCTKATNGHCWYIPKNLLPQISIQSENIDSDLLCKIDAAMKRRGLSLEKHALALHGNEALLDLALIISDGLLTKDIFPMILTWASKKRQQAENDSSATTGIRCF